MTAFESEYEQHLRDWDGVPTGTRNAFARWWHDAFLPLHVRPWFPPFEVAAAMPDETLRCIRQIGSGGIRCIRARASRLEAAA